MSYPENGRKLVGRKFVLSVTRWAVWSRGQQSEHTCPPKSSRGDQLNRVFEHADFDNLLAKMHDDPSCKFYWIKSPPNRWMDDVIPLWWSRESWYDFSPSWLKFSSWWDFFLTWCHFTPWCDQLKLETWYDFSSPWLIFRLSAILFDLVLFHILVWSTASWYDFFSSWCDLVWFGVISYLGANN